MTRPEIESQLRTDNPTTTDDLGTRHGPGSEVYESSIQRWADAMESQAENFVKQWPNVQSFMAEFLPEEIHAIANSTISEVITARFLLSTWLGHVASNDPRIVQGLELLVLTSIITQERHDLILHSV